MVGKRKKNKNKRRQKKKKKVEEGDLNGKKRKTYYYSLKRTKLKKTIWCFLLYRSGLHSSYAA